LAPEDAEGARHGVAALAGRRERQVRRPAAFRDVFLANPCRFSEDLRWCLPILTRNRNVDLF
jgi:hypothetical protein